MDKTEFRVLIKLYFLSRKTLSKAKGILKKYNSDSVPSYKIVQKWFTKFRCGRMSTEIISSSGFPNEMTTPKIINKIHNIILNDPKVEVCEIAEVVFISTEHVVNILHSYLFIKKQCNFHAFNYLSPDSQHFNTILSHHVIFIITFSDRFIMDWVISLCGWSPPL